MTGKENSDEETIPVRYSHHGSRVVRGRLKTPLIDNTDVSGAGRTPPNS
jgi:hypothetical protein